MSKHSGEGFRPGSWWAFDSGIPLDQLPPFAYRGNAGNGGRYAWELEYLVNMGQASPEELDLYEEEKQLPPEPWQVEA